MSSFWASCRLTEDIVAKVQRCRQTDVLKRMSSNEKDGILKQNSNLRHNQQSVDKETKLLRFIYRNLLLKICLSAMTWIIGYASGWRIFNGVSRITEQASVQTLSDKALPVVQCHFDHLPIMLFLTRFNYCNISPSDLREFKYFSLSSIVPFDERPT